MIKYIPYLDWLESQYEIMYQSMFEVCDINSGSYNIEGIGKVQKYLEKFAAPLNGEHIEIQQKPMQIVNSRGRIERIKLSNTLIIKKRPEAPIQILLGGHMDTVFPVDSSFQKTEHLENNVVRGPGVADLKGGLILMFKALEVLERSPWANAIGWEVVLNPDEEIGSPGSAEILEACAKRNDFGMIYEPAFPDGNLASDRKGSGNFTVVSRGKAVHAGREFQNGRNAIRAIADFIQIIDDLNGQMQDVTINPGYIQGGGAVNIVPDLAIHKFNVRIARPEDELWVLDRLKSAVEAINKRDGITLELHGTFNRKPKIITEANKFLFDIVTDCGTDLGMNLSFRETGGCCDGNNLASAGLPNIDNIGVRGDNIHSEEEFMYPESLVERAKLSALILMKIAYGEIKWKSLR